MTNNLASLEKSTRYTHKATMPVPLVQAGAARWVAWNRRCGFI